MFGMHVLTYLQIDAIVLDFPIFPALGNGGAQRVDLGSKTRPKLVFFSSQICYGGTYEHPYSRYRVAWQIVAKIGPRLSKIWWTEKTKKNYITRPKYNSLPLSLKRHAGDCNKRNYTAKSEVKCLFV